MMMFAGDGERRVNKSDMKAVDAVFNTIVRIFYWGDLTIKGS